MNDCLSGFVKTLFVMVGGKAFDVQLIFEASFKLKRFADEELLCSFCLIPQVAIDLAV